MISRKPSDDIDVPLRMVNTEVKVYSTVGTDGQITSCGKITGKCFHGATDDGCVSIVFVFNQIPKISNINSYKIIMSSRSNSS